MLALRALVLALIAGCSPELMRAADEAPRLPAYVGPPLGQSTAMGPADSTRPLATMSPSGVPENVGPGMRITAPGPGGPQPTQEPAETTVPAEYSGFLYAPYGPNGPVTPIVEEPPPPVFQPPPPPPAPDLSDQVIFDEEG